MNPDQVIVPDLLYDNVGKFLIYLFIRLPKVISVGGILREIVKMGPDGYIYFTVENPGYVFRLIPVS